MPSPGVIVNVAHARQAGRFAALVGSAASAAQRGEVVHMLGPAGAVALTWSADSGFTLTPESLWPPEWEARVSRLLAAWE